MKYRNLFLGGILIFALTAVYTAVTFAKLPDRIAVHWNIQGQADSYSDKGSGAWLVPVMQLGLLCLFIVLPFISPEKARLDSFARTYNTVCLYVLGFLGFVQVLMLQAALGPIDMSKWIICGVMVLLGLIGNLLTKARRNYWMGIRTPWTLESEEVWNKTHRFGGRLMVAGAAVGLVGSLLGAPVGAMLTIVLVASIVPVFYSYFVYRTISRV